MLCSRLIEWHQRPDVVVRVPADRLQGYRVVMLDLSPSLQVVVDSPKDDADLRVVVGEGLAAGCPACSRNSNFNPSRSMKSLTLKGTPHFYLATLDVPVAHSVGWACLLCCMLLKSLLRNLVGLVRQHVESPVVRSSNSWC